MAEAPAESYGEALRATVASSAFPYGYTLTIWTSGAVLGHARGLPTTVDALLFAGGAVAAYSSVALAAFRGRSGATRPPRGFALWDGAHVLSVGAAIGAATLVAHLLDTVAAWAVCGFLATGVYLAGTALQLELGRRLSR